MNLFNVTTGIENACSVKPRAANDDEIKAYMEWQRQRHGLPEVQEGCELHFRDHNTGRTRSTLHRVCIGATFGAMTSGARWEGEGREREYIQAQYENGAYSVIMPGWNAHRAQVTMETLDEAGEIVTSSTLPVEPKKGGIIWDKKAVHAAVGPIAKPKKARKRKAAPTVETETPEIVATVAQESEEAVTPVRECAEPVEALSEAQNGPSEPVSNPDELQGECMAAFIETLEPLPAQSAATPTAHIKRSPAHERAIRRAWKERSLRRSAAKAANMHYADAKAARAERNESVQEARKYQAWWEGISRDAAALCAERDVLAYKRRRSTILARDLQKRLNAEHHLVDRANERRIKAEQERDAARQTPTYFDEVGIERRDAATVAFQQGRHAIDKAEGLERRLSEANAKVERQQRAIEGLSAEYEAMAKRALKAERDMAAVEARLNGWPPAVRTVGVNFALAG